MSSRRGIALVELLASALICAVAVGGLLTVWIAAMSSIRQGERVAAATQLARTELERAKMSGFANLRRPTGASFAIGSASRDGDFIATASWSSEMTYYTAGGHKLPADAPSSERILALRRSGRDVDVQAEGSDYTVNPTGQREVVATVTDVQADAVLIVMGTELVRGGF